MNSENRHKRICKAPYRKWTEMEERKLLKFLKQNQPIEKPTAQSFYRRFISENNVNAEWHIIRSKVKNMRQNYKKIATQRSSRSTNENDNKEDLLKKCPLFNEYEEAFGYMGYAFQSSMLDSDSGNTCETNMQEQSEFSYDDYSQEGHYVVPDEMVKTSMYVQKRCRSPEYEELHEIGNDFRTELDCDVEIQNELLTMRRDIQEKEIKLKETELELEKLKILFEKEKHDREAQRKDKELEMEHQLRVMEMEMKKEVTLREIEMKEKIELEKLKKT